MSRAEVAKRTATRLSAAFDRLASGKITPEQYETTLHKIAEWSRRKSRRKAETPE